MVKNITIAVLGAVVIGLLIYIGVMKKPDVKMVPPTEQQNVTEDVSVVKSTNIQDPQNSKVSTYTSYRLGIRFSYQNSMIVGSESRGTLKTVTYAPTEAGNTINLNGHTIEVFEKNPKDTFQAAVAAKFLANISTNDCIVQMIPPTAQYNVAGQVRANILPLIGTPSNEMMGSGKCPPQYTKTNGVSYFMYNPAQADRFVFISGGQDVAALSPDGVYDFLQTVEIIERGVQTTSEEMTYSSEKLGVKFNYLKDAGFGPEFEVKPMEVGNKITLKMFINGKENIQNPESDYIIGYERLQNETTEALIKRVASEDFKNSNCIIVPSSMHYSYRIVDKRFPPAEQGGAGFDDAHPEYANICHPKFNRTFTTLGFDQVYPVYYVSSSNQAVFAFADKEHKYQWFQTISSLDTAQD